MHQTRGLFSVCLLSAAYRAVSLPSLTVLSVGTPVVIDFDRPAAVFTEAPPVLLRAPAALSPAGGCPAVPAGSLALYMSTGYVGLCVANLSALPVAGAQAAPVGFDFPILPIY